MGWSPVAEAPMSDTCPSREETAGSIRPVSIGKVPETPESNEETSGWMAVAEAPISETWLNRELSAGCTTEAAGSANSDEMPGWTPVGKVGMTTAFPIVFTAEVASAKIELTADTRGTPVRVAPTPVA